MKRTFFSFLITSALLLACAQNQTKSQTNWVFVQGGEFLMGEYQYVISKRGDTIHDLSLSPRRMVTLDDFYISEAEITVAEFREFCRQTGRQMPDPPLETAYGEPNAYEWQDEYPMLATWDEANDYAKWVGGRLPTEAEWEYAAKGGKKSKGFRYSGSNIPREVGWVAENSDSTFHPVKLLKPNELGLYDMTGNLNEWVSDWYNPEMDHLSGTDNPTGPPEGLDNMKISKGVGWYYDSEYEDGRPLEFGIHLSEVRYYSPINTRNNGFGFRVAKDE